MELNKTDEAYSKVYFKILNFLSFNKRTKKELLDKLEKYLYRISLSQNEKSELRDRIISNLKIDGYLKDSNDEDYAEAYIQGLKNSSKPFNSIRIFQFLSKKGISKEIIEDAIGDIDNDSVHESVLRDAQKKIRSIRDGNAYQKKQKLIGFLLRKGYPFDIVSSVVDTLEELQ